MYLYRNKIKKEKKVDCFKKHKTVLFMIGEIGTNDYTYALFEGKTHEEVKALVPHVILAIKEARTIDYGAIQLIVPGNLPIGCLPIFLTDLNILSMYHNHHLQQAIEELQKENPNVSISNRYKNLVVELEEIITSALCIYVEFLEYWCVSILIRVLIGMNLLSGLVMLRNEICKSNSTKCGSRILRLRIRNIQPTPYYSFSNSAVYFLKEFAIYFLKMASEHMF
ncbi:hypothetical protein SCA6_018237 [Theobroma cacao]